MTHDPLADFDREVLDFLRSANVDPALVTLSTPPEREFGDRATNVAFSLAREWRKAPRQIAAEIAERFDPAGYRFLAAVEPAGSGFINFRINYSEFIPHVIAKVREAGDLYGRRDRAPRTVVVEHTSVNPNKEWHIGHLRNAVLGDVVVRLFRLAGDRVQVQNYIDDTGLQAAQAVAALRLFPEEKRPGEKYDQYVGRGYVKINAELGAERALKEAEPDPSVEARLANIKRLQTAVVQTMHGLEGGEYRDVVEGVVNGQLLTAFRLGVFYDLLNWESHIVKSRIFEDSMATIEHTPHVLRPTSGHYAGALVIDTGKQPDESGEPKYDVLIRSNGIPTYLAKDIAYHMWKLGLIPDKLRYIDYMEQPNGQTLRSTALQGGERDFPVPDTIVNVIAVHQSQEQEAVKTSLRVAGFEDAAERYIHLAYGMVSTAEGKLSGRKGTAASADGVIADAVRAALDRVREKRSQDLTDEEMVRIAEAVGVAAVRYFMVQYNPMREIVFDVADVVSYDGNTGLYVQYALVRTFAILRRAKADFGIDDAAIDSADPSLLTHVQEGRLAYHIAQYPDTVATAARTLAVNLVTEFAFDLATIFSQFYRDCGVLNAEPDLRLARLLLVRTVRDTLINACSILGLPVIERL